MQKFQSKNESNWDCLHIGHFFQRALKKTSGLKPHSRRMKKGTFSSRVMWWPDLRFCLCSEQKKTPSQMWCHVQNKQFGNLLFPWSRYKIARAGEALCGDPKGKFSWSTNFPNYTMAVSEGSCTLRLETDLMQLWTLQNTVCACCGIRCVKVPPPFPEHFHLGLSKLISGMKELFLTWYFMSIRCTLASAETVDMKASGKNPDLQPSGFVSWCCSGFNLTEFLLGFALNGVNRVSIAGQIQ